VFVGGEDKNSYERGFSRGSCRRHARREVNPGKGRQELGSAGLVMVFPMSWRPERGLRIVLLTGSIIDQNMGRSKNDQEGNERLREGQKKIT